jgi:hypothetical protein
MKKPLYISIYIYCMARVESHTRRMGASRVAVLNNKINNSLMKMNAPFFFRCRHVVQGK